MPGLRKNVFIFFNGEAVAKLLPGMSGRAQDTVSKNPGR
jgi:hypothetical protein